MLAIVALISAYLIGSVPIAWISGRRLAGIDLRETGSGNVGASNFFQSVSRMLVIPVGGAQVLQGLAAVLLGRLLTDSDSVPPLCAAAALAANNWNPWLGWRGGRGVGLCVGAMLGLSWAALAVFIVISLAGVAVRAIPQGVALGLLAAPLAAGFDAPAATAWGLALLAALVLVKRVAGNELPAPHAERPAVWINRLVYDRDIRDRDAWVRRNITEP